MLRSNFLQIIIIQLWIFVTFLRAPILAANIWTRRVKLNSHYINLRLAANISMVAGFSSDGYLSLCEEDSILMNN